MSQRNVDLERTRITRSESPRSPRDATIESVERGRCQVFCGRARYRLCQTGADLICEAFVGTWRPRIIIKILFTLSLSTASSQFPPSPASRRLLLSAILHSIPSWINLLMAGSLICAPLQNNAPARPEEA